MKYDVLVIGGGMGGLAAAITAARRGLKTAVAEAEARVGRKILATGNGKCNFSNTDPEPWNKFNRPSFVRPVLEKYGGEALLDFWRSVGIYPREIEGRIYPHSMEASAALNALRTAAEKAGVDTFVSDKIEKVQKGFTAGGHRSGAVILATGSAAGTGFSSYSAVLPFGHRVTPLYPSLGPLITDKENLKGLKGVRVPVALVVRTAAETFIKNGEIIFKDNGISGSAAFDMSVLLARLGYTSNAAEIDFAPDISEEDLALALKSIPLEGFVHKEAAKNIRAAAGAGGASKEAHFVKHYPVGAVHPGHITLAQVTSGGLETDGFDPNTLESVYEPNFYAVGEVLDVDGECGGYNLMWAACSGIAAGNDVLSR